MAGMVFCVQCGGVVGVYEPVIVVEGIGNRRSSLAREPELTDGRAFVMHAGCARSPAPHQHDHRR